MFNGNTMSVVTDLNIIGPEINNIDFISIAAITTSYNYPKLSNIYNASILVPPTEILMAWADNAPLILYIPKDEFNIFGSILLNHLYYTYGITCNFNNVKFYIDSIRIPFIISKFFMMDLMEPMDYIELYPCNVPLPEWVINKLAIQLNPFNGKQASFTEYYNYFNSLNANTGVQPKKCIKEMIKLVGE